MRNGEILLHRCSQYTWSTGNTRIKEPRNTASLYSGRVLTYFDRLERLEWNETTRGRSFHSKLFVSILTHSSTWSRNTAGTTCLLNKVLQVPPPKVICSISHSWDHPWMFSAKQWAWNYRHGGCTFRWSKCTSYSEYGIILGIFESILVLLNTTAAAASTRSTSSTNGRNIASTCVLLAVTVSGARSPEKLRYNREYPHYYYYNRLRTYCNPPRNTASPEVSAVVVHNLEILRVLLAVSAVHNKPETMWMHEACMQYFFSKILHVRTTLFARY